MANEKHDEKPQSKGCDAKRHHDACMLERGHEGLHQSLVMGIPARWHDERSLREAHHAMAKHHKRIPSAHKARG